MTRFHRGASVSTLGFLLSAALVASVGLVTATPAVAQVQVVAAGGITFPTAPLTRPTPGLAGGAGGAGTGFQGMVGLAFPVAEGAVDIRVEGVYSSLPRDFDQLNQDFAEAGFDVTVDGNYRVIGGGAGLVYYANVAGLRRSDLFPYFAGGVGVYSQQQVTRFSGDDVVNGGNEETVRDTRLGVNGGVGLIYAPGTVRFFIESRIYTLVERGSAPTHFIPVMVGVKIGGS